jgi:hypothetical protein
MKKFLQDLFVNYGLAIPIIFSIDSLTSGDWSNFDYLFQLLFVIFVIRLLILLTNKFQSRYPILEYLLELGMVLTVVLSFGLLFEWYDADYLGMMIVTIVIVYAAVYAVGIGRTRRDAAFINEQIKLRRAKLDSIEKKESE